MQGAQIINSLKINDPICLWTNELNKDFSKEEVQLAKKIHKEMLSILGHN
jgi:hypothetical protein